MSYVWTSYLSCYISLQWRHNGRDSVSNHQPHDCLRNHLFRRRSKNIKNKTSKLRVNGLCVGNSPGTGEFPAQMASNAENVSIWWRHHGYVIILDLAIKRPNRLCCWNDKKLYFPYVGIVIVWRVYYDACVLVYNKNPCVWLLWHWSSRGQFALSNPLGLTASWVLSSTDRVKISVKEAIQNGFLFSSHT